MSKASEIDLNSEILESCNRKLFQRMQRLQMDNSFYDVHLVYPNSTEGIKIPSVKKLLSTHSDYFKNKFLCAGNGPKELSLEFCDEIPISIFKMLHNYIFTASLDIESISLENQIKLFRLTKFYQFEDVKRFMLKYFILKISADTCWELLNLSAELTEERLGDECARIIARLPNLMTNSKFLSLNAETMEFLLRRNTFTLQEGEISKLKKAWNEYHDKEVTFKEIAAEITQKSHDHIALINSYYKVRNVQWKARNPSILPIMRHIIKSSGLTGIIAISTLLGMGVIAYYSGITIALAAGGPILVATLGVGTGIIAYKIFSKRAIFIATADVLKLAEQKFNILPSHVRVNNVELEKLIDDSISDIIIKAFHITLEEMTTALTLSNTTR